MPTVEQIRRSPVTAREIVHSWIPAKHQSVVLRRLARSIIAANGVAPSKWGVRLSRNSIMLKVGFVEVLQFGRGWFHQLVSVEHIPASFYRRYRANFHHPRYVNAPGCTAYDSEIAEAVDRFKILWPAHQKAIQIASRSRIHTTTARDHSQSVVEFLSRDLSVQLPQPDYAQPSMPRVGGASGTSRQKSPLSEGAPTQVLASRFERNRAARQRCIEYHGTRCIACGIDLTERYGPAAAGLIHVHHLEPLSASRRQYKVDPVRDLRPVCPNCHAVIHLTDPPRTISQVRRLFSHHGKSESGSLSRYRSRA